MATPDSQPTVRCRVCRTRAPMGSTQRTSFLHPDVCRSCQRACRRKKRYPTYQQAKAALAEHRRYPWDDPTAGVYRCKVTDDHYHWGHAGGRAGRRLAKRAEKQRRKKQIADLAEEHTT